MSRYLTAGKITTLVLVDLYLSAPSAPLNPDLQLLEFISAQILPVDPDTYLQAPTDTLEAAFNDGIGSISSIKSTLQHCDWTVPGRSVYDEALQRLWQIKDVDTLESLFIVLKNAIAPIKSSSEEEIGQQRRLTGSSPLGVFVRRCCVEFTRLQFGDALKLWKAFERMRQPSYQDWSQRNPSQSAELAADAPEVQEDADLTYSQSRLSLSPFVNSAHDVEILLNLSISRLQKLGVRLPSGLTQNLRGWISTQQDPSAQSSQHFLAFFEAWKSGQHSMAVENLHRYFDYSLAGRGNNNTTEEGRPGIKQYYQYALLHLSVLHADFEYWGLSLEAMRECIATARENQDNACLAFALSWQMYLRQTYSRARTEFRDGDRDENLEAILPLIGQTELDEIAFLKSIAREGKHWTLLASALLEEAKFYMSQSGTSPKALACILQSQYLVVYHDLRSVVPAVMLFQGASAHRLGQHHLALQMYDGALVTNSQLCPIADRVRASCRVAVELAQLGRYAEAMASLDAVSEQHTEGGSGGKDMGSLRVRQRLVAFRLLIQAKECQKRDRTADVRTLLEELSPFLASSDSELSFEVSNLTFEHLVAVEDYDGALTKLNTLLSETKHESQPDISKRLHLLMLKGRLFAELPGHYAAKGLSLILRVAAVAERYCLIPILQEALGVLCLILLELEEYVAVRDLARSVLPAVIESPNLDLQARVFISLGEAHVGIAGYKCSPDSVERKQNIRSAMKYFDRSLQASTRLNAVRLCLDALVMKARLLRFQGDETSANLVDEIFSSVMEDSNTKAAAGELG